MTKVLFVEPVEGEAVREADLAYLTEVKEAGTELLIVSLSGGPQCIETYCDEALAVPEILRVVRDHGRGCDAIIVNCFADPGVRAAREIVRMPVVGPAEASMALALLLGQRFGIVTAPRAAAPQVHLQARTFGVEDSLVGAVGLEIGVLELEREPAATTRLLIEAAQELIDGRRADVIILGCTGMAPFARDLRGSITVPVIEPMAAALKTAETLVALGLSHPPALFRPPAGGT